MFSGHPSSEDARARPGSSRRGRLATLALVVVIATLVVLGLEARREDGSTLEPPF